MTTCTATPLSFTLLAATALAQSPGYLFTTSQTETTLSGSAGTVLQTLRQNEVASLDFVPCPFISAEKWAPLTCFNTMAGNDDADLFYYEANMFGAIDALCDVPSPIGCASARSVFYSPSVALGSTISGPPGLRPGDTGRIVRNGSGDGQVEYFLKAEDLQLALGMPISPIVVDVDAIAADPGYGVFFSVDGTHVVNAQCGVTQILDGDLWMIDAASITWTFDFRVQSVVPGSAFRVFTEAQMDAMVATAGITDRFGACQTVIQDLESLDIDYSQPIMAVPSCTGVVMFVPTLVFSGELMTGCGLCDTGAGGQIHQGTCTRLGNACGSSLATLGNQLGLQPTSSTVGVPSYVNALTSSFVSRFVVEPQQHVVNAPVAISLDLYTPPVTTFSILFANIVPPTVAPSLSLPNCFFPDIYILPWVWSSNFNAPGFQTVTTPIVPFIPGGYKAVFQAGALVGSQIILSTPATVDVF